ncbi:pathogenesis-related protein PR-4-like [Hibiscus syriacus]|uniref:pathogenesis-related protein PR-4-like n=1 Tax=Hibiscus syriacus TaxID=106335 RepID=UPI0019237483|nr:pathogenesis-related protein PR-4-like [Hibiscus syriacus]
MERSVIRVIIISCIVTLGWAVGSSMAAENATAYYASYKVIENHWSLTNVGVYCSQFPEYANNPFEWRSKYYWTAFCGPEIPKPQSRCGLCLKVTNTANGKSVTVRVLDTCTMPSLDLDHPAFSEIEDYKGGQDEHLTVNYELVDCGDDPTIRLYHAL